MSVINVHYFASFREKAGIESEAVTVEFKTFAELYAGLNHKYNFGLPADMVQVAVNDEFASMNDQITPGSKVVFIPPVAGG
jgi:molybdopterin synthase sulfur carrier subunit